MIQRAAAPSAASQLSADRFRGSAKLEACFAGHGRLREADPDGDATARVQQALLDLPAKSGNTYDLGPKGADGHYGRKTAAAIRKFKADENLGAAQYGDVGPGTIRRLDQLFVGDVPPKPKPRPRPKEDNELLASLFHNRELEQLFDKIVIQFGKMMREQGAGLTEAQQDLATAEKPEKPFATRMLVFAAEESLAAAFGGAVKLVLGESLKSVVEFAIGAAGAAGGEKLAKTVEATFDAAIDGGKDVIKETISPSPIATQPLAAFIDSQHNALIHSHNRAHEAFVENKNGAGGADQGLRTLTDEDKATMLSTAPLFLDRRVERTQKLLDGFVDATAKAKRIAYRHAMREWALLNAQMATDDNPDHPRGRATDPERVLNSKNAVPGVLDAKIDFVPVNPKKPVVVTALSIYGLGKTARDKIAKRHGNEPLGSLFSVIRVKGERGASSILAVKTETQQRKPSADGTSPQGWHYLAGKDERGNPWGGLRILFKEVETQTINGVAGRLDGID